MNEDKKIRLMYNLSEDKKDMCLEMFNLVTESSNSYREEKLKSLLYLSEQNIWSLSFPRSNSFQNSQVDFNFLNMISTKMKEYGTACKHIDSVDTILTYIPCK